MKFLYQFLNEEETETWKNSRGEEAREFHTLMRNKYMSDINADFSKLHPDNKRLIRELLEILGTICENLYEVGDVWMNDLQTLQARRHELSDMMKGEITRIREEVPE